MYDYDGIWRDHDVIIGDLCIYVYECRIHAIISKYDYVMGIIRAPCPASCFTALTCIGMDLLKSKPKGLAKKRTSYQQCPTPRQPKIGTQMTHASPWILVSKKLRCPMVPEKDNNWTIGFFWRDNMKVFCKAGSPLWSYWGAQRWRTSPPHLQRFPALRSSGEGSITSSSNVIHYTHQLGMDRSFLPSWFSCAWGQISEDRKESEYSSGR